MTVLNFTENDGVYTADFVMNGATALHIEKGGFAPILLSQKSDSQGEYVKVKEWKDEWGSRLDTDLVAQVYPKFMRVVTSDPVDLAYIVEG